jgi:hypothetical protein
MTEILSFSFLKKKWTSLKKLVDHKSSQYKIKVRVFIISLKFKFVARKGIFPIEFKSHHGIGAKLVWCLEILLYCKKNNLVPYFKFSYIDSKPEEDFFSAFFQTNYSIPSAKIKFVQVKHIGEASLDLNYNKILDLSLASELMNQYIIPKTEIVSETESFCKSYFNGSKTIGVHFRSTDKMTEAPPVDYPTVLKNIEYCLEQNPHIEKIFITTDDKNFLIFMQKSHLSARIVFREDSYRSSDGIGIHNRPDVNKYDINRDAVINMMILRKCDFILKSASFLSAVALIYNPSISFAMLNKPFDKKLWFPESELIKQAAFTSIN